MTVLVTGGVGGLGRAVAAGAAKNGHGVAIVDVADDERGGIVQGLERQFGVNAVAIRCDLADRDRFKATWALAEETVGAISVVINCAGSYAWNELQDITETVWEHTLSTNLSGPFNVCRHAANVWRERGTGGSIVNVASTAAVASGFHEATDYGAAKAGLVGLTRHLAVKLGPHRIRVNAVAPGSFRSPMNATRLRDPTEEARSLAMVPLGRIATVDEVAVTILHLALDATYVNGVLLPIDGGTLARM